MASIHYKCPCCGGNIDHEDYNCIAGKYTCRICGCSFSCPDTGYDEDDKVIIQEHKSIGYRIIGELLSKKICIGISGQEFLRMNLKETIEYLQNKGFYKFHICEDNSLSITDKYRERTIKSVIINGQDNFRENDLFPINSSVVISYYMLKKVAVPISCSNARKEDIKYIEKIFREAGIEQITCVGIPDLKLGWLIKEGQVENIIINGESSYKQNDMIGIDSKVLVRFHTFSHWTGKSKYDEHNWNFDWDEKIHRDEEKRSQAWEEENRRMEERRQKQAEEDQRRRNTPCRWDEGISYEEFRKAAYDCAKRIKRLRIANIDGPFIICVVESQSGITDWKFYLDFNDWGSITGRCWLHTDNGDSSIPHVYTEKLATLIHFLRYEKNHSE